MHKQTIVIYEPPSFKLHLRCLAFPWKLKVSTNSPLRVSLCRTRNTPWPLMPPCSTRLAASDRANVPWNHGYSRIFAAKSASTSSTDSKSPSVNSKLLDVDIRSPALRPIVSDCIPRLFGDGVVVVVSFNSVVLPPIAPKKIAKKNKFVELKQVSEFRKLHTFNRIYRWCCGGRRWWSRNRC